MTTNEEMNNFILVAFMGGVLAMTLWVLIQRLLRFSRLCHMKQPGQAEQAEQAQGDHKEKDIAKKVAQRSIITFEWGGTFVLPDASMGHIRFRAAYRSGAPQGCGGHKQCLKIYDGTCGAGHRIDPRKYFGADKVYAKPISSEALYAAQSTRLLTVDLVAPLFPGGNEQVIISLFECK